MKIRSFDPAFYIFLLLFLPALLIQCVSTKKNLEIQPGEASNLINAREFRFVAQSVTPLRGTQRQLTSQYDVTVKKDSLVSYLPYFGRAYQAPMNPSEGGIQFTSTKFSYDVKPGKKNSWNIDIKPEDQQSIQQLSFLIFDNGTATLNVTATQKDPISFYGRIQKLK
jgi:hypothetical protein